MHSHLQGQHLKDTIFGKVTRYFLPVSPSILGCCSSAHFLLIAATLGRCLKLEEQIPLFHREVT